MKTCVLVLLVALATALAGCGPKSSPGSIARTPSRESVTRYDLDLQHRVAAGEKLEVWVSEATVVKMSMSELGTLVKRIEKAERSTFRFVREVTDAEAGELAAATYAFSSASRLVDGSHVPYRFEGGLVLGVRGRDGTWHYTYEDGTAVEGDDLAGLKQAISGREKEEKAVKAEKLERSTAFLGESKFLPDHPVAVGESWSPEIGSFARALGVDDPEALDEKATHVEMTLESVEERDGSLFGHVGGELEIHTRAFGPLKLEETVFFRILLDMVICIDGSLPDGVMEMRFELGGSTAVLSTPGRSLFMALGGGGVVSMSRHTPGRERVGFGGPGSKPRTGGKPKLPPLRGEIREFLSVLDWAPPDSYATLAAKGLAVAERDAGRFPPALVRAFDGAADASRDVKAELIARTIEESMAEWEDTCREGEKVFRALSAVAPGERATALWEACKLERYGLVTAEEARTADPMFLALAHLALRYLERHDALEEDERKLLWVFVTGKRFRRYASDKGFSIEVPVTWDVEDSVTGFEAWAPIEYVPGSPPDTFRENVSVDIEELPRAVPVGDYAEAFVATLKTLLADFDPLEREEVEISGYSAVRIRYVHTVEGVKLTTIDYLFVKDRRAYVASVQTIEDAYERYAETFARIFASFRIR